MTKGVSEKSFKVILDEVLKDMELNKKDIENLKEYSVKLEKDGLLHIQKVGLVRFNPFKDTGGDQSFILSLMDGKDTGVVISGLYSRSGTRWYAKKVVDGKGVDYELSEEEKKSLKEARGTDNMNKNKIVVIITAVVLYPSRRRHLIYFSQKRRRRL